MLMTMFMYILSHSFYVDDNQHNSDSSCHHYWDYWGHCYDNIMHIMEYQEKWGRYARWKIYYRREW